MSSETARCGDAGSSADPSSATSVHTRRARHTGFPRVLHPLRVSVCLILLTGIAGAVVDAQTPLGRRANTWAARSSTGQLFSGTWTANEDPATGAVTGTWTLFDAQRRVAATGGWSAAKSASGWSGSWRAVTVGRAGEQAGTWTATSDLPPGARLSELFVKAIQTAISGTWVGGRQSGAWTIQAFK